MCFKVLGSLDMLQDARHRVSKFWMDAHEELYYPSTMESLLFERFSMTRLGISKNELSWMVPLKLLECKFTMPN